MKKQQLQTTDFKTKLSEYKRLIDDDIAAYSASVRQTTLQSYGVSARLEIDSFLDILDRGGKRIRGALVMLGYEMSGGTDQKMIIQAARAIEMIHAYILMIDDIQDRSPVRRGKPSAHIALAEYHQQHELAGDSAHFGISIALLGAIAGMHAAQQVLANLDVDPELRLKVISIINRTMLVTAHGQTNDIMNEVVAEVSRDDINRVLEWKTATYTLLNPVQVGMVLTGAECETTTAITDYAMNTGIAFQITDDILGTFGTEFESGKSPMDDIREGKRTLLVAYALEHCANGNKNYLLQMLGDESITPAQFERCKDILIESGAVDYAQQEAKRHVTIALASLEKEAHRWSPDGVAFLKDLAHYLLRRTS